MDPSVGVAILCVFIAAALGYGLFGPRTSVSGLANRETFDAPRKGFPGYRKYMRALRKG